MKIDWHPYPEEKPYTDAFCLVTFVLDSTDEPIVDTDFYRSFGWENHKEKVIAWAELPEPYDVPKRDPYYNHPDEITARKYMERDPETLKALGIFD